MKTETATKQSPTEQAFWSKIHGFRQRGVCGDVTREDATQFFGSKVTAEIYARHDYFGTSQIFYTLRRSGGLNKRTTVRCCAFVNGKRTDERTAMHRLNFILESK